MKVVNNPMSISLIMHKRLMIGVSDGVLNIPTMAQRRIFMIGLPAT